MEDYGLLKVPNSVIEKELKKTIKELNVKIGELQSEIDERIFQEKRLLSLTEKELNRVKNKLGEEGVLRDYRIQIENLTKKNKTLKKTNEGLFAELIKARNEKA